MRPLFAVLVLVLVAGSGAAHAAPDPFAPCDAKVAAEPTSTRAPACYYTVAVQHGLLEEGARRLETLLAARPDDPGVLLALANCESDLNRAAVEDRYRGALRGFAAAGDHKGIVFASLNLSTFMLRRGHVGDARPVLETATTAATASGDPALLAAVRIQHARVLVEEGTDLGRAHRILLDAEASLFPGTDTMSQQRCLYALGMLAVRLARPDDALGYFRRLLELARARQDPMMTATALNRLATTLEQKLAAEPRDARTDELLTLAREAMTAGAASGNGFAEVQSRLILAASGPPDEAAAHLARCHVLAAELGQGALAASCRQAEAWGLTATDPARALALIDGNIAAARERGDRVATAIALQDRAILRWRTGPPAQAVRDAAEAAEAIEAVRDRQRDDDARADLIASASGFHGRVAGQLLAAGDVTGGFAWMERLRARSLLDSLELAGGLAALGGGAAPSHHRDALDRIEAVQQVLLDPELDAATRQAALTKLAAAERDEAAARDELAAADPRFAALRRPTPVAPEAIAAALAPDQALITFQLAPPTDLWGDSLGGSWAVVISHAGTRAIALGDGRRIEAAIAAYLGLVERRDGSDAAAATALRDLALRDALAALPAVVRRLVIVPDGALHRVPWAALLVDRYELTVAPSATVWARLRGESSGAASAASAANALVFADPEPAGTAAPAAATAAPLVEERGWSLADGTRLGRLPHARTEARAISSHLGATRILVGAAASEDALKHAAPGSFRILHLAAHALLDDVFPGRSAVLLAPGAAAEDGLLQLRDVLGLDLRGRVVVLSACRSAAGSLVRGDGVHGLSRAFLAAGAAAVIGSLWPLRDDDAAALFDAFYRHLARGRTLEAALAAAQRDRMRAGAPAAAWAGVVLIGDGARAPVAARPAAGWIGSWSFWLALAAFAFLGAFTIRSLFR